MALTTQAAFNQFRTNWVAVDAKEISQASSNRESLEQCLKSNFGTTTQFFRSGSHQKGTAVGGYSDMDFFAVLPEAATKGKSSSDVLSAARTALNNRYPQTEVRVDSPAVKVKFAKGERSADVVPAVYAGNHTDGNPIYKIADGGGGWIHTSPVAHGAYLDGIHKKSNDTLRDLIRFLKAWKYYRSVPILSFHLEMFSGYCARNGGSINPGYGLKVMLGNLASRELSALNDPLGVSGRIPACRTQAQKDAALTSVNYARDHAQAAYTAEQNGDHKEAIRQWGIVFNGNFPTYG